MARLLLISSQVASGHVGLSAMQPALHAMGHETVALPTILLSNHPGHPRFAGERVAPGLVARMLAALDANGWLDDLSAVVTGYLPSAEHVAVAAEAVKLVATRSPGARFICDPILGDDPKGLYIAAEAALALRAQLVPMAEVIVPNRFELAWLSEVPVTTVADAVTAAHALAPAWTIATSLTADPDVILTVAVGRHATHIAEVARHDWVPNGTGDLLTAIFAGTLVAGHPMGEALERSVGAVRSIVEASLGHPELQLIPGLDAIRRLTR